eukprot:gb/GEZN01001000.1/.p1 GENE.gb/GEZN01001000.1/~~gb/GEZN01001000.1/.p1  ORF type:complete len:1000 (-),score=116.19 gb/GEZN01001000.1/:355-3354(-)
MPPNSRGTTPPVAKGTPPTSRRSTNVGTPPSTKYSLGEPISFKTWAQGLKPPGPADMAILCKAMQNDDPTCEDLLVVDASFLRARGVTSPPVVGRIVYGLNEFRDIQESSRRRSNSHAKRRGSGGAITTGIARHSIPSSGSASSLQQGAICKGWLYQRCEGKTGSGILSKLRGSATYGDAWNKLFAVLSLHHATAPDGMLEIKLYSSDSRDTRVVVPPIQSIPLEGLQAVLLPPERYGKPFCLHLVPAGQSAVEPAQEEIAFMFKSESKLQAWVDAFREHGIPVRSILKSGWLARRIETTSVANVDEGATMDVISVSWKRQWAVLEIGPSGDRGRFLFYTQEDAMPLFEFDGLYRGCAVREAASHGKPNSFIVERPAPSAPTTRESLVLMAFSEGERAFWLKSLQRLPEPTGGNNLSTSSQESGQSSTTQNAGASKPRKNEVDALREQLRQLEIKLAEAQETAAQQTKAAQSAQAKLYDARTQLGQTRVLLQQASPRITPPHSPEELEGLMRATQLRSPVFQEEMDDVKGGSPPTANQNQATPDNDTPTTAQVGSSGPGEGSFQALFSLMLSQSSSGLLRLQHIPSGVNLEPEANSVVAEASATMEGCGKICDDISQVVKSWLVCSEELPQLNRQCREALTLVANHVLPADLEHLNFLARQRYFPLFQALQRVSLGSGSSSEGSTQLGHAEIELVKTIARSWRKQDGMSSLTDQLERMPSEGLFPGFLADQVVVLLYFHHPLASQLLEVHRSLSQENAATLIVIWQALWTLALEILRHASPKENLSLVLSDLYAADRISPAELGYLESLVQGNDQEPFILYSEWLEQGDYCSFAEALISLSSRWHNDLSAEEHQLLVFLLSFLADAALSPLQFQQLEYALYLRDGSLLDAFSVLSAAAQRQTPVTHSSRPRVIRIRRRSAELRGFLNAIARVMSQIEPLIPPKLARIGSRQVVEDSIPELQQRETSEGEASDSDSLYPLHSGDVGLNEDSVTNMDVPAK